MENDETKTNSAEMNEKELPDVRAFGDEFTRSLLQSTEETKPGYYPFVSGTGAYKMDFPADGAIDNKSYSKKENGIEGFLVGVELDNEFDSLIDIKYNSIHNKGDEISSLNGMQKKLDKDLDFKQEHFKDRTLYLSSFIGENKNFFYVGFIQNEFTNGGIEVIYEIQCSALNDSCTDIENKYKSEVTNWMKSIKFIHKKESE